MPFHKTGAYDGFDSIAEAKQHYKRCRTLKHFILSNTAVTTDQPSCTHCGKPIDLENGNRSQYFPKSKKVAVMHYKCVWENTLDSIYKAELI